MAKETINKHYEFYNECLKEGYTDYSDNYQRQKIQLLAKKHGILSSANAFSEQDFKNAKQQYERYVAEQERIKQNELDLKHEEYVKELQKEEAAILSVVKRYSEKKGRQKITAMCNEIINKNQQIVDEITRKENKEYRSRREIIIPSALVGGTIEGLTGSRMAGVYNAVNHEAVNDAKKAKNASIAWEINRKYAKEKHSAENLVSSAKSVLNKTEMSYIETDMLLAKYLVFKEVKMFISETGALRIYANLTMNRIKGLPNDINAYIDGTMKALIYKIDTNEVVDEVLLTLGYQGLGNNTIVEGVSLNTTITPETIDDYDWTIVDYNLFAVEDDKAEFKELKPATFKDRVNIDYYYNIAKKAYSSGTIQGYKTARKYAAYVNNDAEAANLEEKACRSISDYYYNVALEGLQTNEVDEVESAIKALKQVDETDEKAELSVKSEKHLAEAKKLAEEKRIAEEQASIKRAEEAKIQAEISQKKAKKAAIIAAPFIVLIAIAIIVYSSVIVPKQKYEQALSLQNSGNKTEAMELFAELGSYRDSKERLSQLSKDIYSSIYRASNGDIIVFGTYEQDNNTSNGKEEIEWIVLKNENNEVVLLSRYGLDVQSFNSSYSKVNWKNCSLRKWLNGEFFNNAFSKGERHLIKTETVDYCKNIVLETTTETVNDKVFLVSSRTYYDKIANLNLVPNEYRKCQATEYALANSRLNKDDEYHSWWLRDAGYFSDTGGMAGFVNTDGQLSDLFKSIHTGAHVDAEKLVRPVIIITFNSK